MFGRVHADLKSKKINIISIMRQFVEWVNLKLLDKKPMIFESVIVRSFGKSQDDGSFA